MKVNIIFLAFLKTGQGTVLSNLEYFMQNSASNSAQRSAPNSALNSLPNSVNSDIEAYTTQYLPSLANSDVSVMASDVSADASSMTDYACADVIEDIPASEAYVAVSTILEDVLSDVVSSTPLKLKCAGDGALPDVVQ